MTRAPIRWDSVHARLRSSERALEEAVIATPKRIEDAFRERAVRLARQLTQKSVSPGAPAILFQLGEERYAIQLEHIAEVLPCADCTPVPGAPAEFLGVISVRGELRSVLNLSAILGVPRRNDAGNGFVLMVRDQGQAIGLRVDTIEEVRDLRLEGMTGAQQVRFVKGVLSGTLMVLDLESMLADLTSPAEILTI